VVSLRGIVRSVGLENNRNALKEVEGGATTLRHALNQALQQNAELKSRLARIHRDSSLDLLSSQIAITSDTVKSDSNCYYRKFCYPICGDFMCSLYILYCVFR